MENEERKTKYQKHNYLYFGGEQEPDFIDIQGTLRYLSGFGFASNPLEQARKSEDLALHVEDDYVPNKEGVHYCDYCQAVITGVEYEVLDSGLERCLVCASTALRREDQFVRLFDQVRQNMEAFYGISLRTPIKVRMVNAAKLNSMAGYKMTPTPGFDGRVLGFARKDSSGFSLYIENGCPKLSAVATMAHEMTHIWQYLNWNAKWIRSHYGPKNELEVYEGMAKWAEIQYLFYINEIAYGKRQQIYTMMRDDEYGRGFLKYLSKYPLTYSTQIGSRTPFANSKYPL